VANVPDVELIYRSPTLLILRCANHDGQREIRLGTWAVRQFRWEKLVQAFDLPRTETEL
jgi:hypothetical protein